MQRYLFIFSAFYLKEPFKLVNQPNFGNSVWKIKVAVVKRIKQSIFKNSYEICCGTFSSSLQLVSASPCLPITCKKRKQSLEKNKEVTKLPKVKCSFCFRQ